MARPAGVLRLAVLGALQSGPCTLRDITLRGKLGYGAARYTVQDALRSGVVQICGQEKRPHAKRWLAVYELVLPPEQADQADQAAPAEISEAACMAVSRAMLLWARQ